MPKLCEFQNCRNRASYGNIRNVPIRCKDHKGDMKVTSRICAHEGCKTNPTFNLPGQTDRLYCSRHKKYGMVNVLSKTCAEEGCLTIPNFNLPGQTKGLYCAQHKKDNMINVKNKKCLEEGCMVEPVFNLLGQTNGLYCAQHKKDGMVNVKDDMCAEEGCIVRPNFNLPGQTKGLYCAQHKKEGMMDVKHKTCAEEGCLVRPTFNLPGQTNGIYCTQHKKEAMINVIDKTCAHEGCLTIPTFNLPGKTIGLYCTQHKNEDMICVIGRCKAVETGEEPLCQQQRNPKYKGYCTHCFANLFPKDPLTFQIRSKTKEIAVRDFINANFEGFLHDTPMYTAHCDCSIRRRIDHRKLIGNTIFAIETDENQHKSYDKMDEETRYDDLFCAFSGKWVYIRFNPDKYVNKKGERKNPMISTRLFKLKEEIEKQIKRIEKEENTELIERIYMYYDKYD